jgi:hypothetical protein
MNRASRREQLRSGGEQLLNLGSNAQVLGKLNKRHMGQGLNGHDNDDIRWI